MLYESNGNAILSEPMKSGAYYEAVRAYTVLQKQLIDAGIHPKFQMMDNKESAPVKGFIHKENIQYQLVPPHIHICNAAEREI
jgi:hypothetical protein